MNKYFYFENENFDTLNSYLQKNKFSKIIVLTDSNTLENCYPILARCCSALKDSEIIEIEPGEKNKSIDSCIAIWQTLTDYNADKNTLLINLGGGVVCDLGGFVASAFKRGISFIHIPTSLLAMADASVGGKCGIDFMGIKNQIGSVTQPDAVFIHPIFLNTLSNKHLKNGLAEIIKIAFVSDQTLQQQLASQKTPLEEIIKTSVELKWKIVKKDPFDKNIRQALNFGHTIGHALESAMLGSKKELLHGEAVAIGMIIEAYIALKKKLIPLKQFNCLKNLIVPYFVLPKLNAKEVKEISRFLKHDKKNKDSLIYMSLIESYAGCKIKTPVNTQQIDEAIQYYLQLLK